MAGIGTPCVVCGMVPTKTVSIQRNVGMILLFRVTTLKKPLCRVHGRKVTREYLGKTLVFGWWGAISLFVNLFVIASDLKSLGAFRGLPEPTRPAMSPTTPAVAKASLGNVAKVERHGQWLADPYVRHQYRWIVGSEWTDQVCDDGQVFVDPPGWATAGPA